MAEERLDLTLDVDKTGDESAFRDAKKEVEDLASTAQSSSSSFDQLDDAIGGAADSVDDLGQKGASLGKLEKGITAIKGAVGTAVLAVGTFKAAWDQTREAVSFLREQFGIDVDAMIQKTGAMKAAVELIVESVQQVSEGTELEAQRKRFEQLGISMDQFSSKAEENSDTLRNWSQAGKAAAEANAEALRNLGLDATESLTGLEEIISQIDLASAAENFDLDTVREKVGGQIQQLAQAILAAGSEIPERAKEWIDKLGISLEEGATRVEASGKKLVDSLLGSLAVAPLQEQATAINAALAQIGDPQSLPTDKFASLKQEVQGVIDRMIAAGQQIPLSLAQAAAGVEVFVPPMNTANFSISVLSEKATGADAALLKLGGTLTNTKKAGEDAAAGIKAPGDAAGAAKGPVGDVATEAAKLAAAQKEGATEGQKQADSLLATQEAAASAATSLAEALSKFQDFDPASMLAAFDQVLGKLDQIISKAAAADAAIDSMNSSSSAPGPVPSHEPS